jgi:hypothetical protein
MNNEIYTNKKKFLRAERDYQVSRSKIICYRYDMRFYGSSSMSCEVCNEITSLSLSLMCQNCEENKYGDEILYGKKPIYCHGISIDPKLRVNFDITPNEKRSVTEMKRWWNNPFVESHGDRYDVRCLDGGAWDRPTFYDSYDNLEDAINHAKTLKESLSNHRFNGAWIL